MFHWLLDTRYGVVFVLLSVGAAVIAFYLLLAFAMGGHPHPWGVFWLDLLAGWTVIGWIAALVWALIQGGGEDSFDGGDGFGRGRSRGHRTRVPPTL